MTNALQQASLNQVLEQRVDAVFTDGHLHAFLDFAQETMPPLTEPPDLHPVEATLTSDANADLPALATLQSGPVKLAVSRELGIRLYYRDRQVTTDLANIPTDYPWFHPDPADRDRIAEYATRHVARGSRADTWPEDQWPQVGGVRQGEQNWPPRRVAFGPYRLRLLQDGPARAIGVTLPSENEPNAYGVIPRGIFSVTPAGAVVMAWQNDNRSEQGLQWAAWFILGFAMPAVGPSYTDPSVIFAFPDTDADDPVCDHMTKIWNYAEIAGQKVALINPHIKTLNEPFKKFYRDTNWSVVAVKGADHLIVTRSILQHDEQFFPFLEHGRYFIEAEHTGRRAAPGEKSTVIVQHDFVSISALTEGTLASLSTERLQFEQDVRMALAFLIKALAP